MKQINKDREFNWLSLFVIFANALFLMYEEKWSINQYFNDINNPDKDFTISAMDQLVRYLENHNLYDENPDPLKDIFPNSVIQRMNDKDNEIASSCFKIIILFARAYPLELLNSLFGKVYKFAAEEGLNIITQISSILREIFVNSKSFDKERRGILKSIFLDEYRHFTEIETSEKTVTVFYIETCSYFVDAFYDIMDHNELSVIFDIIKICSSEHDSEIFNCVVSLTKIFTSKLPKDGEFMNQIIDFLFEMEDLNNAMKMLSAMITYKPRNYGIFFEKLINCYIEQLSAIEADYQQYEENQEEYIDIVTDYIQTISSLINAFPEKLSKLDKQYPDLQYLESILYFAFNFINYSSIEEPMNLASDKDDEIVIQNDDDSEDFDDDDSMVGGNDESWKIRRAAILLSENLIKNFPDAYLEYLRNNDYIDCFLILIHDVENSVQLEAFELIKIIIKAYGNDELIKKQYTRWIERIITQLYIVKKQIIPMALELYSQLVLLKACLPIELSIKTFTLLNSIADNVDIQCSIDNLAFTIFKTQLMNDELIKIIINVFLKILDTNSSKSTTLTLQIIQHLYMYMNGKVTKELNQLTEKVIQLSSKNGEIMNQSLLTISIYLVLYPNGELSNKALNIIIESLNNGSHARATPNILALIAASPSYKIIQEYSELISKTILFYLGNVDSLIVYKSLCTLNILLQKKVINLQKSMIPELLKVASGNNKRCQLLSFQNILVQPTLIIDYLDQLVELIQTKPYGKSVIDIICKIIFENLKTSKERVTLLIKSLITGKSQSLTSKTIITNIAHIVTVISQQEDNVKNDLLKLIDSNLKEQGKLSFLNVSIIGELGFICNIETTNKTMIDYIFKAISNQSNEISIAASEAIGIMSINSKQIYQAILDFADKKSNISWLFASKAMLKKLSKNSDNAKNLKSNIKTISNVLLSNADFHKETSQTISEALSYLLKINKKYISKLIENAKNNSNSAPISIKAIGLYLQKVNDSKLLISTVKKVLSYLNPNSPILSESCIFCLKIAVSRNQSNISELMEYFPVACEYSKMKGEHVVVQYFGNQQVTQDIGRKLRLYAIETVMEYYNASSQIEFKKLINIIFSGLNDPYIEVRAKALDFLYILALNKDKKIDFVQNAVDIVEKLQEIEINQNEKESKNAFLSYLKSIFYIYKLVGKNEVPEVDKLYLKIKGIPELENIEQDYKVNLSLYKSQSIKMNGKDSIGYNLMMEYQQNFADIFLN